MKKTALVLLILLWLLANTMPSLIYPVQSGPSYTPYSSEPSYIPYPTEPTPTPTEEPLTENFGPILVVTAFGVLFVFGLVLLYRIKRK